MFYLKWVSKMAAVKKSLIIEQYSTFKWRFSWQDKNGKAINLTGYTAAMQVRESVASATVLLELSTANARIVITPAAGVVELTLTDEQTGGLTFKSAVYDLVLTNASGEATRLYEGKVTVSPGVTHV